MARKCSITKSKGVLFGNSVSHSNRKTRRKFMPNMQNASLMSEALGVAVPLRLTPHGLRTIEHNDGLDNYLLTTLASNLTPEARALRKRVTKALAKKQAKTQGAEEVAAA
jgi:large subunit ribosomal protein L28